MKRKEIEVSLEHKRGEIRRLQQSIHRSTCGGSTFSVEEDVAAMQKIEELEEEIDCLEEKLRELDSSTTGNSSREPRRRTRNDTS